jgi:Sec-independent protein translocase protein TatA
LVADDGNTSVLETGLPGLLIILALAIILCGPAPLIHGWRWFRSRAQEVMRSARSKPLQEE